MKEKLIIPTKKEKDDLVKEIKEHPWTPKKIVNNLSKLIIEKNRLVIKVQKLEDDFEELYTDYDHAITTLKMFKEVKK